MIKKDIDNCKVLGKIESINCALEDIIYFIGRKDYNIINEILYAHEEKIQKYLDDKLLTKDEK